MKTTEELLRAARTEIYRLRELNTLLITMVRENSDSLHGEICDHLANIPMRKDFRDALNNDLIDTAPTEKKHHGGFQGFDGPPPFAGQAAEEPSKNDKGYYECKTCNHKIDTPCDNYKGVVCESNTTCLGKYGSLVKNNTQT